VAAPDASAFLKHAFEWLAGILAAGAVVLSYTASRRLHHNTTASLRFTGAMAVACGLWLLATWEVAESGWIAQFDRRPPPFALVLVAVFSASALLAFGPFGRRLLGGIPIWAIVLTQAFRLPLELVMHQAAVEGVMPVQMSFSGWNFDITTGATALVVAPILATGYGGRMLVLTWNTLGTLLLINILTIALLSSPVFAAFGPERLNTFVAYPPFIWLPTVMVVCAITVHMIIWRWLFVTRQ
jgi:hypothetical protein